MRLIKGFLKFAAVLVVLLLIAAVAIPYFFKDRIVAEVKTQLNESVNATIDFDDVDLSLLRDFPAISARLENLSVIGKAPFEGVPLAKIKGFDLALGFWSAVDSDTPLEIKGITVTEPDINVLVRRDGTANYDIALADTAPAETGEATTSPLVIQLQQYAIEDGRLRYEDQAGDLLVIAEGLDHSGSGAFTDVEYDLDTETEIDALTLKTGGVSYLNRTRTALDATVHIDAANSVYTLKDNELTLNALVLQLTGEVAMPGEDIRMDLAFNAPRNNFKNLLSLVPSAYNDSFDEVSASGQFALNGKVNGVYNERTLPAFDVNLRVDDANVQYPDLPVGISDIATQVSVTSPGGSNLDRMAVDIPRFKFQLGNNPVAGFLRLRTPVSNPDVDAKLTGRIELDELARAFPMEGVDALAGVIDSDLRIKAKYSDFEAGNYEDLDMDGSLRVDNIVYEAEGLPKINLKTAAADFTPRAVNITAFDTQLGRSDLRGTGRIDNILAAFGSGTRMTGSFDLQSNYFNLDEWVPEETEVATPTTNTVVSTPDGPADAESFDAYAFDFTLDAERVEYDVYDLRDIDAAGTFEPNLLTLRSADGMLGKSDFTGGGTITNVMNYVNYEEHIGGRLDFRSNFFDLTPLVYGEEVPGAATSTSTAAEPTVVTPIPDYLDLTIGVVADKVLFDGLEMRNVRGDIVISEETARLDDMRAAALGGSIVLNGKYDTKDLTAPGFELQYDMQSLQWQEAFNTFNTFQVLAPIGKFIRGNLNTSLVMSGKLGEDLMPNYSTLSADGFLQTINGVLASFGPLEAVDQKLNTDIFRTIEIPNSKNWFEIANGVVTVKPFDFTFKDIAMVVSGQHSLTNDMDYVIRAKVPRKLLTNNAAGAAADRGLGLLSEQASKLGINLAQGEFVNVNINLGGSIVAPKVNLKLVGTDGESGVAQSVVDDVKAQAQARLDAEKAKLEAEVQARKDSLQALANAEVEAAKLRAKQEADRAKKRAEEEAKNAVKDAVFGNNNNAADSTKTKVGEDVKDDVKDKVNDLKKKFKNPFGGG